MYILPVYSTVSLLLSGTVETDKRTIGGYLDIINNILHASNGADGTPGSDGNIGGRTDTEKGGGTLGGSPSEGTWVEEFSGRLYDTPWKSGGGGQGGNAYGAQGEPGETLADTYEEDKAGSESSSHIYIGAKGGDGATPIKPDTPSSIGTGGSAGHGGGGGGTGGTVTITASSVLQATRYWSNPGKGAPGSPGGDGAPGGIIIYL